MRYGSEIIMCIGVVTPILLSMPLSYNVRCDDTGTKYTFFIRRIILERITSLIFWGKVFGKIGERFHSLYFTAAGNDSVSLENNNYPQVRPRGSKIDYRFLSSELLKLSMTKQQSLTFSLYAFFKKKLSIFIQRQATHEFRHGILFYIEVHGSDLSLIRNTRCLFPRVERCRVDCVQMYLERNILSIQFQVGSDLNFTNSSLELGIIQAQV